MASTNEKEDAVKMKNRTRIMKSIEKAESTTNWEELGKAPEFKWKRNLVSDAMIIQELENVRKENATMIVQVNEMKKEQDTLMNLVKQILGEVQIGNQHQTNAKPGTSSEDGYTLDFEQDSENKGENQRQNPQARDGTKGGNKKAKNTANPPPGSPEFAHAKQVEENNKNDAPRRKKTGKIKRVKTVLNEAGDNIEKTPYEIPRNRYKPPKEIPKVEQDRRKARDEEEKSREVVLCGVPSPKSYTKETPFETAALVMKAVDELKTRYLGDYYGINIRSTDFAFAFRQIGHANKDFTPITIRFRKKEVAEKTLKSAEFAKILNRRGTTTFGKHRKPPEEYTNDKDEVIKPSEHVIQRFKDRPKHFFRVSRTLEQQEADRKARAYRDSKSYQDRQRVKTFKKDQRIEQRHFEGTEMPADETVEEHDPEEYGVLPEIPKAENPKPKTNGEASKESISSNDNSFQSTSEEINETSDEAKKLQLANESAKEGSKNNASA